MHPFTFLACTYNLWGTDRRDERTGSLRRFLEVNRPDILCPQELRPWSSDLILDILPGMRRVEDPFDGWTHEGNIFWNTDIFELVEYGAERIGILKEARRLFWVRLTTTSGEQITVATAHLSWLWEAGESGEWVTVRVAQAEASVRTLDQVTPDGQPLLFMGDFNDYLYPIDVLRAGGFEDSFSALSLAPEITHPAVPGSELPTLLDWMMHRGPIRPTLTSVVDFYVDGIPPSGHKPVLTAYTLTQSHDPAPESR